MAFLFNNTRKICRPQHCHRNENLHLFIIIIIIRTHAYNLLNISTTIFVIFSNMRILTSLAVAFFLPCSRSRMYCKILKPIRGYKTELGHFEMYPHFVVHSIRRKQCNAFADGFILAWHVLVLVALILFKQRVGNVNVKRSK